MTNNEILKKLQVKAGEMVILNAPEGFTEQLHPVPEGVTLSTELGESVACILIFARSRADVQQYAVPAINSLIEDGLLWFAYPKGSAKLKTDINRDSGWDAINAVEFRPVRQISLDETWSVLRFRHESKVNAGKGSTYKPR